MHPGACCDAKTTRFGRGRVPRCILLHHRRLVVAHLRTCSCTCVAHHTVDKRPSLVRTNTRTSERFSAPSAWVSDPVPRISNQPPRRHQTQAAESTCPPPPCLLAPPSLQCCLTLNPNAYSITEEAGKAVQLCLHQSMLCTKAHLFHACSMLCSVCAGLPNHCSRQRRVNKAITI